MGLYPALTAVQLTDIWSSPAAKHWHNINPRYMPLEKGNAVGSLVNPYVPNLPTGNLAALHFKLYIPRHPEHLLPALQYNADEARIIAGPSAAIADHVKNAIMDFITNKRNISDNNEWNAYLEELDKLGLRRWLSIAQTVYERQITNPRSE
jgi:hypothetical protein